MGCRGYRNFKGLGFRVEGSSCQSFRVSPLPNGYRNPGCIPVLQSMGLPVRSMRLRQPSPEILVVLLLLQLLFAALFADVFQFKQEPPPKLKPSSTHSGARLP